MSITSTACMIHTLNRVCVCVRDPISFDVCCFSLASIFLYCVVATAVIHTCSMSYNMIEREPSTFIGKMRGGRLESTRTFLYNFSHTHVCCIFLILTSSLRQKFVCLHGVCGEWNRRECFYRKIKIMSVREWNWVCNNSYKFHANVRQQMGNKKNR